jgi:hypothetical protein
METTALSVPTMLAGVIAALGVSGLLHHRRFARTRQRNQRAVDRYRHRWLQSALVALHRAEPPAIDLTTETIDLADQDADQDAGQDIDLSAEQETSTVQNDP